MESIIVLKILASPARPYVRNLVHAFLHSNGPGGLVPDAVLDHHTDAVLNNMGVSVPAAAAHELPVLTGAAATDASTRQTCYEQMVATAFPLQPGEVHIASEFTILKDDHYKWPKGSAVLLRRTNLAEVLFIPEGWVFDGNALNYTPLHQLPKTPRAHPLAMLGAAPAAPAPAGPAPGSFMGNLAKSFGSGLVSGIGGQFGALIFNAIFPPGVPDYFGQVYQEIGKIMSTSLTTAQINLINGEVNGTKNWIMLTYTALKASKTMSNAALTAQLTPVVTDLDVKIIGPLQSAPYQEAGFTVFMVAGCMHLALLQELALIDPNVATPSASPYAGIIRTTAQAYAAYATTTLDSIVKARTNQFQLAQDNYAVAGPYGGGVVVNNGYAWYDMLDGSKHRFQAYKDKKKNYHDGSEEASADMIINRDQAIATLKTTTLNYPQDTINNWLQLVAKPI